MKTSSAIGGFVLALGMSASLTAFAQSLDLEVTTAGTSAAAETTKEQQKPTIAHATGWPRLGEDEATGSAWWSVMLILGVLGAAGASSVLLRKKQRLEAGDLIEVLASATVAPRTKVVLLGTRGREVLVGIGEKGPILLTEWLADPEVSASATAERDFFAPEAETPELRFEAPIEAAPEPEALLALAQGPAVTQTSAPAAPPKRAPVPRTDSAAVQGLLELRRKADQTPPRGQPVMKSRVRTLDNDSDWSRRLMNEMKKAAGGRA